MNKSYTSYNMSERNRKRHKHDSLDDENLMIVLCEVLGYTKNFDREYYHYIHKNTFALNKAVYAKFREFGIREKIVKVINMVSFSNLGVTHYITPDNLPLRTEIEDCCTVYYKKCMISRVEPHKDCTVETQMHQVISPHSHNNTHLLNYKYYYVNTPTNRTSVNICLFKTEMIEFMGKYRFKSYTMSACHDVTYHLVKIPHNKSLTQKVNLVFGQKAYIFKVDSLGIVRVGAVETVTYKSELFATYDLITGTTYFINRSPQMITLYNQRRHRYDILALSGILEIDEYVPFQYIERIRLANGKIFLVAYDAGRIQLLPA